MRTYYQPESSEFWIHFLADQQYGAGYPLFIGSQYQRGAGIGSFFRGIFRAVAPVLKSVGKTVGKEALRAGALELTYWRTQPRDATLRKVLRSTGKWLSLIH